MNRCNLFLATLGVWCCTAAANEPMKLSQEDAERRFFQCWKEVASEYAGKQTKGGGYGYCFSPDGGSRWLLQGELSSGGGKAKIIIDAASAPMRVDFIVLKKDGTERYVIPKIFKFENDHLIIVGSDKSEPFRKDGNYTARPTTFLTTEANMYLKKYLKRCEYLEQDD